MSPIEKKMLDEIRRRMPTPSEESLETARSHVAMEGYDADRVVAVFPRWMVLRELPVDRYRLDFAVVGYQIDNWYVAVECDGHEWHEKTPEQAAKDRRRDRVLQGQNEGWRILRFTGSEIHRNVVGCADEVFEFLEAVDDRATRHWNYLRDLMNGARR